MASGSLNPFKGIIETQFSPHARTLRTSLGRKILDTFRIFAGQPLHSSKEAKAGLFDYITLMIPFIIHRINHWANKRAYLGGFQEEQSRRHPSVIPTLVISAPLAGLLFIPRFIFAAVATLAVLPIIAGVQLVSTIAAHKLKQEMGALTLYTVERNTAVSNVTIHDFLNSKKHKGNLEIVSITSDNIDQPNQKQGTELEFTISTKYGKEKTYIRKADTDPNIPNFPVQKAALNALLRLNVCGFAKHCEEVKGINLTEFSKNYLKN